MTTDAAGNLVIADSGYGEVQVVATHTGTWYGQQMTAGRIYTVAGGGTSALGNGVVATAADLVSVVSATVDPHGNLVFAAGEFTQVVVATRTGRWYGQQMTAGHLYIVAGTSGAGLPNYGGLATKTERGGLWVLMVVPAAGCPGRAAWVGVRDSLPPGWVFPAP